MIENTAKKILIETNQFCNLNCTYCFYNDFGRSEKYLTINDIKRICEKYKNADDFYLTGGECTLNNNFDEIVDYLTKRGNVTLFTNGISFSDMEEVKLNNTIKKIKKTIITYDSYNSNYKLRKGFENKVSNSIARLVKFDSEKLEVKICLSKHNFKDFENTILYLINIGVKHISINYIKNILSSTTDFELSEKDIEESFSIINKYKKYFNKENIELIQKSYREKFKNYVNCIAGEKFIYIDCFRKEFYCPSSCKILDDKKENNCFGKHCINLWEMFI